MKLYLVRHGQTDMNKNNMFYGWTDADINETGLRQAEELKEFFQNVPLDAIYSSDLRRAAHTAEIIASGKGMQVQYEKAFRELYYGDWENRPASEIKEKYGKELRGWVKDWKERTMPNGEAFPAFYRRVAEGVEKLIAENKGKHILLVSHNGALSALLCHLTEAGMDGFWRFDSKQGHYSAVLATEKWRTIDCLNHPLCGEERK